MKHILVAPGDYSSEAGIDAPLEIVTPCIIRSEYIGVTLPALKAKSIAVIKGCFLTYLDLTSFNGVIVEDCAMAEYTGEEEENPYLISIAAGDSEFRYCSELRVVIECGTIVHFMYSTFDMLTIAATESGEIVARFTNCELNQSVGITNETVEEQEPATVSIYTYFCIGGFTAEIGTGITWENFCSYFPNATIGEGATYTLLTPSPLEIQN